MIELKNDSQRGVKCTHFLLFIGGTYVERVRWNRAWHHSQAKDNSIECLSKMGQKFDSVTTYKLLTQSRIRYVMLPDREHSFATHMLLIMK